MSLRATRLDAIFLAAALPIPSAQRVPAVGVEYVVHLLAADPDNERVQRIVLAAFRSEPIREAAPSNEHLAQTTKAA